MFFLMQKFGFEMNQKTSWEIAVVVGNHGYFTIIIKKNQETEKNA